jgi:hypothetical protein
MNKRSLVIVAIVAVAIVVTTGTIMRAQGSAQVRACASCEPPSEVKDLPPIPRGPMDIDPVGEALSILSFDDGTCESGLGAGTATTVTDFVDFDVPTQCSQSGLDVVGVTTRLNTGLGLNNFAFGQAGATPPAAGAASLVGITPINAIGPCPGTALTSRSVGPGAAVINGTANFFAGVQGAGFAGRDSNGPPAGRIWLNCATCMMTQYTPTDLSGLGLGGNWMIRVTVEDQNCVPVELMGFDVS